MNAGGLFFSLIMIINIDEIAVTTIESGEVLLAYNPQSKKLKVVESSGSNGFAQGSLSVIGGDVSYVFGLVTAQFVRLNETELALNLSSSETIQVDIVITPYGPSSITTDAMTLTLTETPQEIFRSAIISTKKIEFLVNKGTQSYFIVAAGNSDYSRAWLSVTRYN